MVRSPWSERKYYSSDVRLVPARRDSDPNVNSGTNNSKDDTSPNMSAVADRKKMTDGASARAMAQQAAAGRASGGGGLPPPSPRATTTASSSTRNPSPVPMRDFNGSRSGAFGFDHDPAGSQFQPPARLSSSSATSAAKSKDAPSSSLLQQSQMSKMHTTGMQQSIRGSQDPPPSPRKSRQQVQLHMPQQSPYLKQQQQQQQQQQQRREPAPASPSSRPISVIRDSWAQRDREATENGIQSSTFRQANIQQRSPSAEEMQRQAQAQQMQHIKQQQRPASLNLPTLVTPRRSQSPVQQQQQRQPPSPMMRSSSPTMMRSSSPTPPSPASNARIASLSQTLNLQAEQLATMERDYLNLISNLESEKRRVHEVLDVRTKERDTVRTEVERLQRQLVSTSNLSVQAEEEEQTMQGERISSLEQDLQKCKEVLAQRDELIQSRNTELESMREAVCQAAEEKLYLQEQARVDGERRDKFQNGRLEKAMETVAEKDELIREKEVEIDELRESIYKRKQERDALKLDVQALQEELEGEQANIAELKTSVAGYRLEIRRLEAQEREREENAAARTMEDEMRDEAHATATREAEKRLAEMSATIEAREEENDALRKLVEELKDQLQQEQEKTAALFEQLSALKADLETAKTSTPDLVQRELEEQADKISSLELELCKKDDDIETKAGEILRLQTELSQVAVSNTNLCRDLEKTKGRLGEEVAKSEESKQSFDEMHQIAMKNLTDELLEAQAKLVNAQDHGQELKRKIEKMEDTKASEEMDALKAQLEETQAEARQLVEKCNALEDERRKEKSYLEQLEKEVSKQKEAADAARELSTQNFVAAKAAQRENEDKLNEQYLQTKTELEQVQQEKKELESSLAEKDDLLVAKDDELQGVKAMIRAFEMEQEDMRARLRSTQDKLKESRTEAANAAAVASASKSGGGWLRRGGSGNSDDTTEFELAMSEKDRIIEAKSVEVKALMEDLQKCMQEREAMRDELEQLRKDMDSRIEELLTAQRQHQEASLGDEQLRADLDQSFAENADLKQEIDELKEQLFFESRKSYRMEKKMESLSASKDFASPQIQSRSIGSDDLSSASSDGVSQQLFRLRLDEVARETERKRERMNRIRERASFDEDGSHTTEATSAKFRALEASLEEKEAQLKSKSTQVEELEKLMNDMALSHANQANITKECSALEKTVSEYQSRVDDLKRDLSDRDQVVNIKNEEIEILQQKLDECMAEKQALIDGIAELKSQLEAEAKRSADLVAAEKDARDEIARLENVIRCKEEEVARLSENNDSDISKDNEIMELREQLIHESRNAFSLSKEVESLRLVNVRANEEIQGLKEDIANTPIRGPSGGGSGGVAHIWHENESLKHEFDAVSHQLNEVSKKNADLKSELSVLRRKDADAGRTSAVFRSRMQSPEKKKPWASPAKLAPPKSDSPHIDFGEGRDDYDDDASNRGQSRGERRSESPRRSASGSSFATAEEIDSLKHQLDEVLRERDGLDEAVCSREKYISELEYKCSEYSAKISELKRFVTAQSPSSNAQQALALKEKEVERLHKDMVSLKMLASAKFRELESKAARAIDYEEQAQALRVALDNAKADHAKEIAQLKAQQGAGGFRTAESPRAGTKGFRESKLQHKYEVQLKKMAEEKDLMRKEIVALTAERRQYQEKFSEMEEGSMDMSSKIVMSENNNLKMELAKMKKESIRLRGKLEYYELI